MLKFYQRKYGKIWIDIFHSKFNFDAAVHIFIYINFTKLQLAEYNRTWLQRSCGCEKTYFVVDELLYRKSVILSMHQFVQLTFYKEILSNLSSGQTLGVKAQRFRGHTSPHRNVKEKKRLQQSLAMTKLLFQQISLVTNNLLNRIGVF
eukprot:TRINITY_DN24500_c0_g1_i8.p3 TRINITY_DN24500_c0_g1~~TRINITY_DN24500_c0_g1_i8.p3  ORF type:complete len:148 (-),score=12.94 TRINITY_DN24500_c0_g1_i8:473-916(-)